LSTIYLDITIPDLTPPTIIFNSTSDICFNENELNSDASVNALINTKLIGDLSYIDLNQSYSITSVNSVNGKYYNNSTPSFELTSIINNKYSLLEIDFTDISNVNLDSDFDMLVIDGPPSYKKGLQLSRYPAISLIQNKLKKDGMFYMDDFRRTGEEEVLKKWEQKIKLNPGKKNLYGKGQIYFK
jgi:hypothetical protein